MIVDKEWMSGHFDRFNRESFGGTLPTPAFRLSRARTRMGSCSWKVRRRFRATSTDYTISMSTYYDFSEQQACEILLHEMIHYALALARVRDTSAHGRRFQEEAARLNRKYGLHITAMAPAGAYKVSAEAVHDEACVLIALRLVDGRCYVGRMQPRCLSRIERELGFVDDIQSHHWYVTTDSRYTRLPKHRTLRGRLVKPDELERMARFAAAGLWRELVPGKEGGWTWANAPQGKDG